MTIETVFARALAAAGACEQAAFFNEFASELTGLCKNRMGTQLWHIAEQLDQPTADIFKELFETRAYHKAEYQKDQLRRDELRREIWDLEKELKVKREALDG